MRTHGCVVDIIVLPALTGQPIDNSLGHHIGFGPYGLWPKLLSIIPFENTGYSVFIQVITFHLPRVGCEYLLSPEVGVIRSCFKAP